MSKKLNFERPEKFPSVKVHLTTDKIGDSKVNYPKFYSYLENVMVTQKENFKLSYVQTNNKHDSRCSDTNLLSSKTGSYSSSDQNASDWNIFVRSKNNRFSNYRQLPVIEEEVDCSSEDEVEFRNYFFSNSEVKDAYLNRKTLNILINSKLNKKLMKKECVKKSVNDQNKMTARFPSVVNINCLMNTDIKQSQQLWDTNFGKRLISGKYDEKEKPELLSTQHSSTSLYDDDENLDTNKVNNECCTEVSESSFPKNDSKSDTVKSKNNDKSNEDADGDKVAEKNQQNVTKQPKKHPKRTNSKKETGNKKGSPASPSGAAASPRESVAETPVKPEPGTGPTIQNDTLKEVESRSRLNAVDEVKGVSLYRGLQNMVIASSSTMSSSSSSPSSKNQHLLTQCVRSILESSPQRLKCEFCPESFNTINELFDHKKRHEADKQTCLICNRVFYEANDFVQHLLTHESVDKYSCKKCKKYFPTLNKFSRHNRKFHFIDGDVSTIYSDSTKSIRDYFNKCSPKMYECTRCDMKFDTEESRRAHKRLHLKMDLNTAHLLCRENVNAP